MLNKKILAAAVAAAVLSNGAVADIDLDAASPVLVKYAKEALLTANVQAGTVDSVNYYEVNKGAAADIDLTAKLGVGAAAGDQLFVRVDLTNAVLETAAIAANLVVNVTAATSVAQGGAAGNNYAIFAVTAPVGGFAQTDATVLTLADLAISGTASVTYGFSVYETLTAAVNQASSLVSKSLAGAVSATSGLAVTTTTNDLTAEVEKEFKEFTNPVASSISATLGQVGGSSVAAVAGVSHIDGAAVALADMVTVGTSPVVVTGDFSSGAWGIDAAGDSCAGPTAGTLNAGKTTFTTTLAAINAEAELCNTQTGTVIIPESPYALAGTYTPVAGAAFPATSFSSDLGVVDHNGTTVQIPYLTTYSDYNQRLIVVNRGTTASSYTVSFTTEAGVTATPGAAATGTLAANSTTMVKATDLVSLAGGTRTSATLTIVSPQANIDVATTQVNLSDGGTDTVKLK